MEVFATDNRQGLIKDLTSDPFSSELIYYNHENLEFSQNATYFGYVIEGTVIIQSEANSYSLTQGMYFSVPNRLELKGSGKAVIMSRIGYAGFFQIGGPVEEMGRLTYIDGCTDSLLISPVIMGDPCLNLLHIPKNTKQSQHTHPSMRLGVIISGEGICITPDQTFPLVTGTVFYIPQDNRHSFHTNDSELRVIAYHPDSDFGPTHQDHPMVNKTII